MSGSNPEKEGLKKLQDVVLCSRYPVLIEGLRVVLEQFGKFRVFTRSSAANFVELPGVCPDIIVIDAEQEALLQAIEEARIAAPGAAVVLWVDEISVELATQVLGLGVLGILDKASSIERHLHCISKAAAGELCIENDLYVKLIKHKPIKLTAREGQLTSLLTQGLRNKELAQKLGITEGTVKVYLSRLYTKTGANDRFELALFVLRNLGIHHAPTRERKGPASGNASAPLFFPEFLTMERRAA
jgi:DNA-binding NarL/FixJ family response regulator